MTQKVVLTAIIGVLADKTLAQGVQCSGSRTSWGISRFQQNSGDMDCWLNWSGWSDCSGHCGKAVKTANRKCRGNIPGIGGCHGSEIRRKRCSESEIVQGRGAGQTYSHALVRCFKLVKTYFQKTGISCWAIISSFISDPQILI